MIPSLLTHWQRAIYVAILRVRARRARRPRRQLTVSLLAVLVTYAGLASPAPSCTIVGGEGVMKTEQVSRVMSLFKVSRISGKFRFVRVSLENISCC